MSTVIPTRPRPFGAKSKVFIVRSKYNEEFTQSLLDNCIDELNNILPNCSVSVSETPGGFEVPVTVEHIIDKENPILVIAFGVIIRGETMHGDLIATSVTNALQEIAVRRKTPVINEVLLVNDKEQAYARCIGSELNRGREAARAAHHMAELFHPDVKKYTSKKAPF